MQVFRKKSFLPNRKETDARHAEHIVTVYTYLKETDDGDAQWLRTVVTHCTLFKNQGVQNFFTRTMEVPKDKATLYFFSETAYSTRQWLPEHEFIAVEDTEKSKYFTVAADGRDRILEGVWEGEEPPAEDDPRIFRPSAVIDNTRMGSYNMQHVRIVLR